jgi:hypothetical protein
VLLELAKATWDSDDPDLVIDAHERIVEEVRKILNYC